MYKSSTEKKNIIDELELNINGDFKPNQCTFNPINKKKVPGER